VRLADPGLFGPGSASWQVDREALLLAGGTCALLMQLAHPAIAAAVAEHSDFRDDPFGRLRRTVTASYAVVFGSTPRAERAIRRINAIHGVVSGRVPETGQPYHALDPDLLLWVHATLVDTALRVYERYVAPLTPAAGEAYHDEARRVALRFGVPASVVPPTLVDLRARMAAMLEDGEVQVTPTARMLAPSVLYPSRAIPRLLWDAAHLVSFSVMPPAIRAGYSIPWSTARDRGMRRVAAVSRRMLPLVPAALRHVPHARTAERRLVQP
jgi:uncharacterized protein (DUF2236 family)